MSLIVRFPSLMAQWAKGSGLSNLFCGRNPAGRVEHISRQGVGSESWSFGRLRLKQYRDRWMISRVVFCLGQYSYSHFGSLFKFLKRHWHWCKKVEVHLGGRISCNIYEVAWIKSDIM